RAVRTSGGHDGWMPLLPFVPGFAGLVSGWAVGNDVVRAWCAVDGDRVPADVVAGWSLAEDVEAYVFAEDLDGPPVAYGELWLDAEEGEVALARLLVAPEHRGRGVGRALTAALTDRAREAHPELPSVFLRVRPDNAQAIKAYAAAGYVAVPADEQATW